MTTFTAANGLLVSIRPLTADDAPALFELFAHLSTESRYRRFHLALEHPDTSWMEQTVAHILDLRPPSRGWLAFADLSDQPGVCIGGVRLIVTAPDQAEISLTVRDDLQGHGIGTELLRLALEEAHESGLQKVVADTQASNLPVFHLLKRLGIRYESDTHAGETHLEVDLTHGPWESDGAGSG